jgi:hypothetical protein
MPEPDKSDERATSTVPFGAMVTGFRLSVDRFGVAARAQDPLAAVIPLFEALNWAVTLDERVKEDWSPDGERRRPGWDWPARLKGEEEADIVRGVRFIRNRIHHQWADAVSLKDARHYYPPRVLEWVWVPASDLPKADPRHDNGRDGYERLVEGHPVEYALSTLVLIYEFMRQLLEPRGPPMRWIPEDP